MIHKSRYGEGLACRDMAPRLLNVAYPEYPVAAGATACLGQLALVHDSKLTVTDPNPEASHRSILYDSGRPSSVIWFRTLHATTDSATRPPRDRARSRSPRIDVYRKNAFSTRAWSW